MSPAGVEETGNGLPFLERDGMPPCLTARGARSQLTLAVVPNARRTGADGLHDGALRVRLAAPPVDGKANEALLGWLGDELKLPRRAVRIARGAAARRKAVEVDLDPEAVAAWLARVLRTDA